MKLKFQKMPNVLEQAAAGVSAWIPSHATHERSALAYLFHASDASDATAKTQGHKRRLFLRSVRCVRCVRCVGWKLHWLDRFRDFAVKLASHHLR